jgi:hypothetical protein
MRIIIRNIAKYLKILKVIASKQALIINCNTKSLVFILSKSHKIQMKTKLQKLLIVQGIKHFNLLRIQEC